MMKKLLLFFMMLAMAVPLWASEHTVTINRNEGLYQTGTGVYYCVKDGIMMTFTSGLDNENYLVEHQQVYFEVNSYNYIIKRIVFHCVDSTTTANLMDCFYWGPTTLSIVQNFYNQSDPGTLTVTNPYTAVWQGSSNHMQFTTMAKPVRFGSVEIVYDKLDGDIFDLVTSTSQIQMDKTYILVTQNYDKVMKIKKTDDATFPATDIVSWMGPDGNEKSRVKVDGNAQLFRMEMVVDTTIDGNSRKSAWLNTLNGYIRPSSTSGSTDLTLSTGVTDWNRSYSYIGTAYNFLARFKSKGSGYYIRYDSSNNGKFRMYNSTSDANTRVWLYKLAEAYNITTVCDPASGGTLTLGDGAVNSTSQQGETVNFSVDPADGYSLSGVDVTIDGTATTVPVTDNGDGTYSFVMPAQDVTVTAHFEIAGAYQIFTENTPAGGGVVNVGGQVTTVDGNNYANGGKSVTVTPSPNWGWEATGVTVTDANNNEVTVTDNGNGSYSFTMPEANATVHAGYKRVVGDIFDLVTHGSQIQEGQTYIIVSQNYDKVMRFWTPGQTTFTSADIVDWPLGSDNKTKVRVDDNAVFFRMDNLNTDTTSTGGLNLTRAAFLNTMNGYMRTGNYNVFLSSPLAQVNRGSMMVSGNAYNYLLRFLYDNTSGPNTNYVVRYNNADGNFNVLNWTNQTDNANVLTRVWLYKLAQAYSISTVCTPPEGGSITITGGMDESNMAQGGETVTFWVGTNWGYRISQVVVTNNDTGEKTVLNPTTTAADGNNYSFVMPDANVTITATFYETENDLYLLGTAMGRTIWCPSGPMFNYDPVNEQYYLDVYFKGVNNDEYGYFSLAQRVSDFDWKNRTSTDDNLWGQVTGRLAAQYNDYGVQDGSTNVPLYNDRPDNAFKIKAGIYRITVNRAMTQMSITETPRTLTFTPAGDDLENGTPVPYGQVVELSSDIQSLVWPIAQRYGLTEDAQQFKIKGVDDQLYRDNDNDTVITQLGKTTLAGMAYIGHITAEDTAAYRIDDYAIHTVVNPAGTATINVQDGATTAAYGQTVTFTINDIATDYTLAEVTLTNETTGEITTLTPSSGTYSFVMPDAPVTITANLKTMHMVRATWNPAAGGSVTIGDGTFPAYYNDEDVNFTVDVNPGYVISSIAVTAGSNNVNYTDNGNGNYSFTMPTSDVLIHVEYGYDPAYVYNITTVCDPVGAGEFSQVASTSSAGEPVAFTVTPNLGYQLSEVTVTADGTTTTLTPDENGNYSFSMPTADVTVTAHFTPVGVVLRQVMRNSEIVEGKTYAYVTQEYDKSLGYDNVFVSLDIIQWVTPDKYKVKVDGRTVFFQMEQVADTTYGNNCLVAYLKTPLGYLGIEEITAGVNHFQIYPTVHYNFSRNILRIDGNPSSVLWSHYSGCPSGLCYDNEINQFNYSKGRENVWLYKVAESYNVSTACDPVNSGVINLIDGVTGTTALDGDTVTVRPVAADGYVFDHLIVTVDGTTQIVEPIDNHDGTFSFVMPVGDVTVTGYFVTAHYITTVCDPEGTGEIIVASAAGEGHVVPFTVEPAEGYALGSLEIIDSNGQGITPQYDIDEGGYSFEMPGADVTITAHFVTGYHVTTRVLPVLPDGEVCGELNAYWLDHPEVVDYFASGTPVTADLWINKHYVMDSVVLTYGDVVYHLPMEYDGDNYCASTFDMPASDVIVTAYLRFSTPLSYIETPGNFENGDPVTVTDTLIGAWAARYYLWAKDQAPYVSNDFVEIPEGQTDYVRRNLKLQIHDWDQSNWVMLDFSNLINGNDNGDRWPTAEEWTRIQELVDHRIEPSSIHGTYVYDLSTIDGDADAVESHHKCRIILDAWPVPIDPYSHESLGYPGYVQDPLELPAPDGYYEDPSMYQYNHYTPANFLCDNIGGSHGGVGIEGVGPGDAANPDYDTSVRFFFMNPKDQEIAQVWAVWLGKMTFQGQCSNQEINADVFEVFKPYPEGNPTVNGYDLSGAFYVPSWDFNRLSPDHNASSAYGQPSGEDNELIPNTAYQFHVAIMTRNVVSEVSKKAPKREDAAAPEATKTEPWDFYEVYPLDLQSHSTNYTAVQEIMPREASQIESIRYYNVMGQESRTPFDGINIEVIRYKDGSKISRKILR